MIHGLDYPSPKSVLAFFGSFAATMAYESLISRFSSARGRASRLSIITHLFRARYGAGMMPSRSVSSANSSGVHLNLTRDPLQ